MVPKQMNFRKDSKRQLTPTPCPSECSLFLEIMCMHFILSGPHTSLHICNHIHYKNCNKIIQKWGRVGQRPFGIFPKIHPIWYSHPSLMIITYFSTSKKENDLKTPCVNQNFRSTLSFSVTCWPILWKMFLTPCILVFKNYIKTINQVLRKVYKRKDGNLWQKHCKRFQRLSSVSLSFYTIHHQSYLCLCICLCLSTFIFICLCLCICVLVGRIMSPHDFDQLSERSKVSSPTLHCSEDSEV